ncbi:o-succinylbenzoate--CoA ligase [Vibrio kasasachensis]|uniref:o-succinylbenzoate--CoA ligase n=1 Tax=Vibrio kasasachensis TaxID=2910248 RepID=UPI003D0EC552
MPYSPLRNWAQLSPNNLALITPSRRYTWSELYQTVLKYVDTLTQQDVKPGNVVTCVGKNSAELVLIYLACMELGVVCAITMPQPQATLHGKLNTLYADNRSQHLWCSDGQGFAGAIIFNHTSMLRNPCVKSAYQVDALASIIFTSGSMGKPKAVAHSHAQHLASAQGLLAGFHFRSNDTWLLSLPMYHVSGLAIVYRWLHAGASLKVGIGDLLQDIQDVTHVSLVATQLNRLLDANTPLSLTHVLLGGSHVPLTLSQQAAKKGIETWLGYGMTEAASTVTAKRIDGNYSAGRVLPKRKVELRDGHVFIGGETLASGYYCQGQITPIQDVEGWFDSKDLGYWIENGELVIQGRADNQFISGGENIHCEEIEQVLNAHPNVLQSMVVAVVNAQYGARPIAFVSTNKPREEIDFSVWLSDRLERFKHPQQFLSLPASVLNSGIKMSRSELKRWVSNHTDFEVI